MFDEWAAVLRHQDEVSRAAEEREREIQRERQQGYRRELEAQKAELDARIKRSQEAGTLEEREAVQMQADFIKKNVETEKLEQMEKRAQTGAMMRENLAERQRAEQVAKEREYRENRLILEDAARLAEEEQRKLRIQGEMKARVTNALRESYAIQESMKRQQDMREKEIDRAFLAKEEQCSAENERNRQRVIGFDIYAEAVVLRDAEGEAANHQREGTAISGPCAGQT